MLYRFLKAYARLAIKIFCRRIIVNRPEWLRAKGPLLLAANHPNSFLDGIILTILFDEPVYSLARGDAFAHTRLRKLIDQFHLLPVYRKSEGAENLHHNYTTFDACQDVFRRKGIVLIFSEGGCVNEWHLRPLRKGTARLALSSWQQDIPLTALPVGLNYNPFGNFGKNVFVNFGSPLDTNTILQQPNEGRQLLAFNEQLRTQLQESVWEIDPNNKDALRTHLSIQVPAWKKALLSALALAGFLLNAPLYFPAKAIARRFSADHFESVLVGALLLLYPPYLLLISLLPLLWLPLWWAPLLLVFTAVGAWALVQVKEQV